MFGNNTRTCGELGTAELAVAHSEQPLVQVEDLRVRLRSANESAFAVDGVSLSLARGRTIGIVGESGSGKTMLVRSVMGLLDRDRWDISGSIRFDGVDLFALTSKELRPYWGTGISMVFQDPMSSLNPVMRVGKQLALPLRYHQGLSRAAAREVGVNLLRDVGISAPERRIDQYPFELSGGMRQRIMIAIALSCNPSLLLADEPTTALDVTVQRQILQLLQREREKRRMGVVFVTHDLDLAATQTDDVIVMYAGRVVERAPSSTIFNNARHPYTNALIRSIPRFDDGDATRLEPISGSPPGLSSQVGCPFAPRCPSALGCCFDEEPDLTERDRRGHWVACFNPVSKQSDVCRTADDD